MSTPQNDNVAHALAGAGGGILSMALTYPLITLSTRAQVESRRASSSFRDAVRRIIEREGVEGLYSGLNSALFGIAVTNFVYYYWYEWTKAAFERRPGRAPGKRLSTLEAMAAGALAGSATVILTNPIWVVNTRMTTRRRQIEAEEEAVEAPQTDAEKAVTSAAADVEASWTAAEREGEDAEDEASRQEKAKEKAQKELAKRVAARGPTTMGTLLSLLRNEGPAALFAGVAPALVLVINPILQYTLFEQMRNIVERRRGRGAVTPSVAFVLGAIGKLFATTVTYPYITVKSQMHVAGKKGKSESTLQALRRITREEGYAGLYKGIGPKVTQSVLTAAFLFAFKDVLYEQSVRLRRSVARKAVAA